ncbi:MAG: glycerophosphodiester phosphodiesterase [Gemmatimonadales bacterium]|nr:glycerophosphodiester phosphodiesterase [Gemmatimonadales bacterium]
MIAHRGASGAAPENTLAAFELAAAHGADAIELDVRLAADGVPVVLHDATLDRTTDRRGPVAALTAAQLRLADAGARFTTDAGASYPFCDRGVRIPTLADVLAALPAMPVLIEVKEIRAQHAIAEAILRAGAASRCVIASEHSAAMAAFRRSPFILGASGPEIAALWRAVLFGRLPRQIGYRLLSVPERWRRLPVPTPAFLAAARRLECPVHIWTINDTATARRLWARGVAGIVTNLPDVIRRERPIS